MAKRRSRVNSRFQLRTRWEDPPAASHNYWADDQLELVDQVQPNRLSAELRPGDCNVEAPIRFKAADGIPIELPLNAGPRRLRAGVSGLRAPGAIRTDNGTPFATRGIHGLSRLYVWWMRLGIQHQRIQPARSQQNAAHERMHKTLGAEACRPAKGSLAAQQQRFNALRAEYNEERPHAALLAVPPAARYRASPRPYLQQLPPLEYPGHFIVKRVTNAGTFRLKHRLLFIASALKQHHIGLEETDNGIWSIYLGEVLLGRVDERDFIIRE